VKKLALATAAWLLSTSAMAGEVILRAPAPEWLPADAPHLSNRPDVPSQHVRYERIESHTRAFGTHTETYLRARVKILSPLGLQSGSQLALNWNPALQSPTVHSAKLIRNGETLDILDKGDFTILRREAGLEQSRQINGILTGVLIVPDVRIGDTIDFAYSVRTQFDVFGNPIESLSVPVSPAPIDLALSTISWPSSMRVQTRAGRYSTVPPTTEQGGFKIITERLVDAEAESYPERFAARSIPDYAWQISSIPQWSVITDYIRPAYQQAATLPDAADLAAHIARIRAEHTTPQARAVAALRLVQDEVRYLAVTLGEGGWLPSSASEVWASRQGDCKGKTVLLVAILKELGIDAVPALVSSENLPLDKYLPMVSAFDHVIVKAKINGETHLLDGTRIGDRSLRPDVPLAHEYILPVVERAQLEHIPLQLPPRPMSLMQMEIDLSDGIYSPARLTLTDTDRGDRATEMQSATGMASAAEMTRWYDDRWTEFLKEYGTISDLKSQWEYREDTHEFVATATARITFDWTNGPVSIPLAHVTWKGIEPHANPRFKDADYAVSFPSSSSFRTSLILPEDHDVLDVSVEPYEVDAGATRFFRTVERNGNRLETDRGSINLRPFATPAERASEQANMDTFKEMRATMRLRSGYSLTASDRETLNTADGNNPEATLRRGYALFNAADYTGAIAQFDAAIAGFSAPHANALANRALAYLALEEFDKARADIAAAEAADPTDTILFHAKGRLAEIEKDDLEAVLAFTGALNKWPQNTHALYRRSAAYERMGQHARALADLERIATIKPDESGLKSELAGLLLRIGRPQEAMAQTAAFAEAVGYPDATTSFFVAMARTSAAELKTAEPAKAEAILTDALSVESDFPSLLIDRASIRELRGNTRGAATDRARFEELTRIDLDNLSAACVSKALMAQSREAALEVCDKAVAQKPNDAGLHVRRAYLLYILNREEEAIGVYRKAIELAPDNQIARYGLGKMLKDTGQEAEGEAMMAAALEADPNADESFASEPLIMVRTD